MSPVEKLSHDEIAALAAKKLRQMGYIATFANVTSSQAGEQPDALGIKSCGETFLVEAKVSRSDFHADKKKPWRNDKRKSLGHYRAYITPAGLLKPEEVPYGWQLWEVHGKNKPVVKIIKGELKVKEPHPLYPDGAYVWRCFHCDKSELVHFYKLANHRAALGLMATVISRMNAEGVNTQEFASRNGKGFLKN